MAKSLSISHIPSSLIEIEWGEKMCALLHKCESGFNKGRFTISKKKKKKKKCVVLKSKNFL